jgi:hypothetical protein
VEGDRSEAVLMMNKIVGDGYWPGFGSIAAEVDLARMEAAPKEEGEVSGS